MPADLSLFATCLPGLEPLLLAEVRALGATARLEPGGVAFQGDRELLLRAHLQLGTASHVLLRCATFTCRSLHELQRRAVPLPWSEWLRPGVPVRVRATARKSKLYHTGAIVERIGNAIAATVHTEVAAARAPAEDDETAQPAAPTAPHAQLAVRVLDDRVTISLDTSSTPLHRRGYRLAVAKAPLREDLARALLLTAAYTADEPLLDPFCGAGTIAIEAAMMARGLPPGFLRPAPLQATALADDAGWARLVAAIERRANPPAIACGDRDAGAIEATRDNAARADCADAIACTHGAFSKHPWLAEPDAAARPEGLLATNPPFGHRVGQGRDLTNLYQSFGHRARALGPGWRVVMAVSDPRLARRTGLDLRQVLATRHGGLRIAFLVS